MAGKDSLAQKWNFHREREALMSEAHARPSITIPGPSRILHVAFRCDEDIAAQFFKNLEKTGDKNDSRHVISTQGSVRMKLERHTEFMSCALFQDRASEENTSLIDFLNETFPIEKVEILVFIELDIVKSAREMMKLMPSDHRVYGGSMRNDIEVRSTFSPNERGAIQFAVFSKNITSDELGRRIQRLIEMETYRTMTLLGLTKARSLGARLSEIENELDEVTNSLRDDDTSNGEQDQSFFDRLSDLSERTNVLAAETRYRFAASRAYFALFQQRIDSLQEEKIGDLQTISGFLRARLEPAMATIESSAKRHETLMSDLSRAIVLLRTRIELNLNKGNQALLQSMDRRHDQQLKISRTVEGLSVIAITYYATGLASYLLKALAAQPWMPLSEVVLTAFSVPLTLLAVWYALRRIRNAWDERSE